MSGGYYNHRQHVGPIAKRGRFGPRSSQFGPVQPNPDEDGKRLLSFKEFMLTQSNEVDTQEAVSRYSDYKIEFTRRQIDKFFKEHQDEEWFRNKYRPTEIKKFQESAKESKAKRKAIYEELIKKMDETSKPKIQLDQEHSQAVEHFLENFSLMLEGATIEEIENGEAAQKWAVSSIWIPSVHQSIDKAMIEEYAAQYSGFLRVAMSDANPNRDYKRQAWITYRYMDSESLRKLCWQYNSHRFNGQETKAVMNKETNDRIKINPQFWFCHAKSAKSDIKNVAKILTHFEGEDCPMLEVIKDYLIEETNEEEQVLGINEQSTTAFEFNQDPELFTALDKLILYLRVVHSYDYYASTEYTCEDDMPLRVGIMFCRPTLPATYGDDPMSALKEFTEATKTRVDQFVEKPSLSEIDQKHLGKKNSDEEVENFIYQHTFEKKPGEKYVCKLTKKRFTAPEFVRKHIFNRCSDKLDEVRAEVEFFNNYIADPKRPM